MYLKIVAKTKHNTDSNTCSALKGHSRTVTGKNMPNFVKMAEKTVERLNFKESDFCY